MQCSECQTENPARAKYCLECGTRLAFVCTKCRTKQSASAKFCPECGEPVAVAEPSGAGTHDLREARQEFERTFILRELRAHGGNITRAAKTLGIGRVNLWRKLKTFGIELP